MAFSLMALGQTAWNQPTLKHSVFKYSFQPKGYISEGESTIDTQSNKSATLRMITIREILPQFTVIGPNKYWAGT